MFILWLVPVEFIDTIDDYFAGENMNISVSVKNTWQLLVD